MATEVNAAAVSAMAENFTIHRISPDDLRAVLRKGLDDFYARPTHGIFLCVIYPLVALFATWIGLDLGMRPLIFPLITGFALVGPLAASGLYELSRRREQGLDNAWWHVFGVLRAPSRWGLAGLGIIMAAIFIAWLQTALRIYVAFFGDFFPASAGEFLRALFETPAGWSLILAGCTAGFLFAAMVFWISVFSLPMLLDRKVSAFKAVEISIRAVSMNLPAMTVWSLTVAGLLFLGSLPLFFGLAVVIPVLGHSTWHLYRGVVG